MSRNWAELVLGPFLLLAVVFLVRIERRKDVAVVAVVVVVVGQGLLESLDVPAVGVGVVVEFVEGRVCWRTMRMRRSGGEEGVDGGVAWRP